VLAEMTSLLKFDQTTLAALEYVYRKLPPDRDNPPIRKHIAHHIISVANEGQTALAELTNAGLAIVNGYLFPPTRTWLKIFS
jgi:hypothetical protein